MLVLVQQEMLTLVSYHLELSILLSYIIWICGRGEFRIQSSIYGGAFCENYFCKKLYLRHLSWFWMRLCVELIISWPWVLLESRFWSCYTPQLKKMKKYRAWSSVWNITIFAEGSKNGDVLLNMCSSTFLKFPKKKPVSESLFS